VSEVYVSAIGASLIAAAVLVALVAVAVAFAAVRVSASWQALAKLRGNNIDTLMDRVIELEVIETRVERVELDRAHWRESALWQLREWQASEAELAWRKNQERLAAERGEVWNFTTTWPTPEELHRREMTRLLHQQHQNGEHHKTAAALEADA
jgi:hypothetical protein